jgi:hypothetical protein
MNVFSNKLSNSYEIDSLIHMSIDKTRALLSQSKCKSEDEHIFRFIFTF